MTTHFLFPQNKIFDHKIKFNKGEGVGGKLYSLYGSLGKYTVCVLIYTYILSLRGYLGLKSIKLFQPIFEHYNECHGDIFKRKKKKRKLFWVAYIKHFKVSTLYILNI